MRALSLTTFAVLFISGCTIGPAGGTQSPASHPVDDRFGYSTCAPFECLVDLENHAMAAGGARTYIAVRRPLNFVAVRSSDPSVAQFESGGPAVSFSSSTEITVTSSRAGDTDLILLDAQDREIARNTVHVRPAAKLGRPYPPEGQVLILADVSETFHVETLDAQGSTLVGTGAVRFTASGDVDIASGVIHIGDETTVGGTRGGGELVASSNDARTSFPITFVQPSELTALGARIMDRETDSDGRVHIHVEVVARSSRGDVYGPTCTWTTSDPSVSARNAVTIDVQAGPPGHRAEFVLASPGRFTATCAIGELTAGVDLTR